MNDSPLYDRNLITYDAENGLPMPRWLDSSMKAEDAAAREVSELLDYYIKPDLLDPLRFIELEIERIVAASTASHATKKRINGSSLIQVEYNVRSSGGATGVISPSPRISKRFELREIVTDRYRAKLKEMSLIKVHWPLDVPQDLRDALENADLQTTYSDQVIAHFTHPDTEHIYRVLAEQALLSRFKHYATLPTTSDSHKNLIKAFLEKRIKLKTVYFRSHFIVTQAVCLQAPANMAGVDPHSALIMFIGAPLDQAIVELPGDPIDRKAIIEASKTLEENVFIRIAIFDRLKIGKFDLAYTGIQKKSNDYLRDASLTFHDVDDIVSHLYVTNLERLLSDIDTLVSTDTERLVDKLLVIAGFVLTGISIAVMLPTIGAGIAARPLISWLFGMCAVGVGVARGKMADDPQEAEAHYREAAIAAMFELAVLLLPSVAKFAFKNAPSASFATSAFKRMRFDGVTPAIYHDIPKINRYIMPSELGAMHLKRRLIERLRKGPAAAQDMVYEYARAMKKTVEGHQLVVYRGQVFRGDMRPPEEIFREGFRLRTPYEEIQKDIHQITGVRGGFGGGRNALDPDGKGISTSAFYFKENTGAFVYGGQRGGYTYVIDTIDIDGYHLYANHHMAKYPGTRPINLRPTEINYGQDIPADWIIGAYDKTGRFIPNDVGLDMFARRRASEIEIQLAEAAAREGNKSQALDSAAAAR
jgi:hypothetical protein